VERRKPPSGQQLLTAPCGPISFSARFTTASERGRSMRVKSNKALRRSARLARRAFISPAAALPSALTATGAGLRAALVSVALGVVLATALVPGVSYGQGTPSGGGQAGGTEQPSETQSQET